MGMVVPMSPGAKPGVAPQAQPSQTDLLMALAEMHKQGRFDQPMNINPMNSTNNDLRARKGQQAVDLDSDNKPIATPTTGLY